MAPQAAAAAPGPGALHRVRVAVFNTSLSRAHAGELAASLRGGRDTQARRVATILQVVRPDVVLLLEVDRAPGVADLLQDAYLGAELGVSGGPLSYPHRYVPSTNTGLPSGLDLDRDGVRDGPGDAWGFGRFEGQYGMLLLSRFPLQDEVRCAGLRLWRDIEGTRVPDDPATAAPGDWYGPAALAGLPVSSKNHCDVVVQTPGGALHLLVSHPTPPVFDGPEDRNGLRNAAEIELWLAYLDGRGLESGGRAGLAADARFVLAGDLNADPNDGAAAGGPIARLLAHARVRDQPIPQSLGGAWAATRDGGVNETHRGSSAADTADFSEGPRGPGNLRVDYALASANLSVAGGGVFWPRPGEPYAQAVTASDHRLVWVDIAL